MMMPVGLEEAGRDIDLELGRELLHRQHRGMLRRRQRPGEVALVLGAAEVMPLEQLGRQDQLRAAAMRLAHQIRHVADVFGRILAKGELQRGDGELGHWGTCCEMQWKLPPPVRMWSARTPIATRPGKRAWIATTAASSLAAPYCGTTTAALPM